VGRTRVGISVGHYLVGDVSADGSEVRGEGEFLSPGLVVPIAVTLHPRTPESTIALTRLSASLTLPRPAGVPIIVGHAEHQWLGGQDGLFLSLPSAVQERTIQLHFGVPHATLRFTELAAASSGPRDIQMKLEVGASVAWVPRTWNNIPLRPGDEPEPAIEGLGLVSELRPIWHTQVGELLLYVPRERWAEEVLPRVGLDRLRLVVVRFPSDTDARKARMVRKFDAARRALDAGQFAESIRACRDVRRMVQRRLTGSEREQVVDAVARRRGLATAAPQMVFLEATWMALVNLTNSAVHDDDPDAPAVEFSVSDARTCLLLTSVLLEQLADSLDPVV
jgi:hypothetical protein